MHASPKVRKLHFSDFACFTWRFHGSETVQARSIPGSADACALSGAHDAPRLIFLYTSSTETQSYPYWIDMRLYNNTRIYGISFPDATHTHKHKEFKTCGCPTIPTLSSDSSKHGHPYGRVGGLFHSSRTGPHLRTVPCRDPGIVPGSGGTAPAPNPLKARCAPALHSPYCRRTRCGNMQS